MSIWQALSNLPYVLLRPRDDKQIISGPRRVLPRQTRSGSRTAGGVLEVNLRRQCPRARCLPGELPCYFTFTASLACFALQSTLAEIFIDWKDSFLLDFCERELKYAVECERGFSGVARHARFHELNRLRDILFHWAHDWTWNRDKNSICISAG